MAKKKGPDVPERSGKEIIPIEVKDQMRSAYLSYAMSVIVGRALPDARDGLKPVHRRILHAMNERAWRHDRAYVKSAKIVGEVIGNFHPHGDSAVYDTLVRMAQDFSLRIPLIDGQGNFGSVDGDRAAAYRYTEARLTPMAEELLRDIDKETVDFSPNFDDTRKEPVVLPAAWPNLLVNGSSGIAVGMATKIPPHNLKEVLSALDLLIENPDATIAQLMKKLPAPDFPTGGEIIGKDGLKSAYTTGRGSIRIRAVSDVEELSRGRSAIIITEIPYEVKKSDLIAKIANLVGDKKVEGISGIRDESDRRGMRIVLELRKEAQPQIILNRLYQKTSLQVNYGIIFLALDKGQPRTLNLKEMLQLYLDHRKEVITRRTQFELRKAEERAHILEGLKIALDFIDEVIKIIRGSKTVDEARASLMKRFKLTEVQANAILEMRLQKLTSLESKKILDELAALGVKIKELKALLKSETKLIGVIQDEGRAVLDKFGTDRKSRLTAGNVDTTSFDVEDLIANEQEVIVVTENDYLRRLPIDTFKRQARGGKGVMSGGKKEDAVAHLHFCQSLDSLLFFSNRGKVFYLKVHELPMSTSKDTRGKSLRSMISLMADEKITAIRSVADMTEELYLLLLTKSGIVKKLELKQVQNAKKGGIMALQFKPSQPDWLIDVNVVQAKADVFMATGKGLGLRTNVTKMRSQGRSASGIIAMNLEEKDSMIALDEIIKGQNFLLAVTENGYAKRVKVSEFTAKGRGGKGMAIMKTTARTGALVSVRSVSDDSEVIITTRNGNTLRSEVKGISVQGRTAGGVRLMDLGDGDVVAAVTVFRAEES